MGILFALAAAFIAFGFYRLFTYALPTRASRKGLHSTLYTDHRKISWDNRLFLPIAHLLQKHLHYRQETLENARQDLTDAHLELTAEESLTLPWAKGGVFWLLGILFCFNSVFFGICLLAAGIIVFLDARNSASKAAKKRRYAIDAEMPAFVSHVRHAGTPVLVTILKTYLPTAGKTFRGELTHLIADMSSITGDAVSSHEIALRRFASRVRSDMVTRVTLGLIDLDRGEDVKSYFSGLSMELASWRRAQKLRIAGKRPAELFASDVFLFLGILAIIFVAVWLYMNSSIAGFIST